MAIYVEPYQISIWFYYHLCFGEMFKTRPMLDIFLILFVLKLDRNIYKFQVKKCIQYWSYSKDLAETKIIAKTDLMSDIRLKVYNPYCI